MDGLGGYYGIKSFGLPMLWTMVKASRHADASSKWLLMDLMLIFDFEFYRPGPPISTICSWEELSCLFSKFFTQTEPINIKVKFFKR